MPNSKNFAMEYCGPWLFGDMRLSSILGACLDILDTMEHEKVQLPTDEDSIVKNATYFEMQILETGEDYNTGKEDGESFSFILDDMLDTINEVLPHPYWFGPHPDDPACLGLWDFED